MTSPKQFRANRENSKKSTGPKTEGGKARSSANAITHGLDAKQVVIPGEDPCAFEALRDSLFDHYPPQTKFEDFVVEELAVLMWRAMRTSLLEALVLTALQQDEILRRGERELEREKDNHPLINYDSRETVEFKSSAKFLKTLRDHERRREEEFGRKAGVHMGHALISDARFHDVFAKLERREIHLLKVIEGKIALLEKMQMNRVVNEREGTSV